ncbi:hypothetical protein RYX36_022500 [Vicia faba]
MYVVSSYSSGSKDLFSEELNRSPETGKGKQPANIDENHVEEGNIVSDEVSLDDAAVIGVENGSSHGEAGEVPKYSWEVEIWFGFI